MVEVNPPGYLQNAGATHTAEQMRSYMGSLLGYANSASSLQALGGVHPGLGGRMFVFPNGTPNMTVQVAAGYCMIPGTEGSKQGVYFCENDAQKSLTINAADPSLNRIDLVCAKVQDQYYSGSTNTWSLVVVTGTAAGSPVAPTPPANSITLAQVLVSAGVTSITSGAITDTRQYSSSVGGIRIVQNSTYLPAQAYDGAFVYQQDTDRVSAYNGSAWVQMTPDTGWSSYSVSLTATVTNPTMGTGAFLIGRYRYLANKLAIVQFAIQFGSSGVNAGSGFYRISLPVTASNSANDENNLEVPTGVCWLFNNAQQRAALIRPISATAVEMYDIASLSAVSNATPWTWGNTYHMSGYFIYTTV